MNETNDWLIIGKVVGAQGLQGEIRINPMSDFPERFTKPGKRWVKQANKEPTEVELIRGRQLPGKSIYIIRLAGIKSRDSAEAFIGLELLVPKDSRPNLSENEFHLLDLVGLKAKLNRNDSAIGEVKNLVKAGNDLLEIDLEEGRKVLVPFVKEIVPEVNLKEGWLLLDPPPGLLEL